ncbi:MAG: MmcB family DNA repair protein [Bauldia sp.]
MPSDLSRIVPPIDGRQSERAAAIQRGVGRLLRAQSFAMVCELPLSTGHRADVVGLGPDGEIWIVEIKSSLEDFRVDMKWPEYRHSCDRLFFATHGAVPLDIFPAEAGLILADAYGAEMIRHAPEHRLAGARRKVMLVRFAQAAALRLHGLMDPAAPAAVF